MTATKSLLSPARRALIDLMCETYYGSIRKLMVTDGEPVLKPAPRVVRDVRLGQRKAKPATARPEEFRLKTQVVELFEQLDALGTGVIERIDIQAGLPFRIRVAKSR